jgi:hypothetical protein
VHAELDVGTARVDADLADDRDGGVAHLLVFLVRQGLDGGDRDGIARVDAHGVQVFDGADDDHVVREVAHHFHFVFFPTQGRFFHQALVHRRGFQTLGQHLLELGAVVADAAPGAAKRESGTDDEGIALLLGERPFRPPRR